MRTIVCLLMLLLSCSATAQTAAPVHGCLIVKHKGTLGRRLMWTALAGIPIAPGAKFDLVDSVNYRPVGVAFTGKALQAVQASGVKVVVLEQKYQPSDLDSARKSCSE